MLYVGRLHDGTQDQPIVVRWVFTLPGLAWCLRGETCVPHTQLSCKAQMKRNVSRGGIKPTPFYMGDPSQQNRSDTQHRSS